jgi:hypothetical protein
MLTNPDGTAKEKRVATRQVVKPKKTMVADTYCY